MNEPILDRAYVLHHRPFQDTSLIVELWCARSGRISVLAKGAKQSSKRWAGLLQPGIPLWVDWRGRGQLPILTHLELRNTFALLKREALFSIFYLNELIYRGVAKEDPHAILFEVYEEAWLSLSTAENIVEIEIALRRFESVYLKELGYGLSWPDFENYSEETLFEYHPQEGFHVIAFASEHQAMLFKTEVLKKIMMEDYQEAPVRLAAKKLYRLAIQAYLGTAELHARYLF